MCEGSVNWSTATVRLCEISTSSSTLRSVIDLAPFRVLETDMPLAISVIWIREIKISVKKKFNQIIKHNDALKKNTLNKQTNNQSIKQTNNISPTDPLEWHSATHCMKGDHSSSEHSAVLAVGTTINK